MKIPADEKICKALVQHQSSLLVVTSPGIARSYSKVVQRPRYQNPQAQGLLAVNQKFICNLL